MSHSKSCDRRRWLLGSAAGALVFGANARPLLLLAQQAGERPSARLIQLEDAAKAKGISTPMSEAARGAALSPEEQDAYRELAPRLADLIERSSAAGAGGREIADRADDLLGTIHAAERGGVAEDDAARAPRPSFDSLRAEYRSLFDTCEIRPKYQRAVDNTVKLLKEFRPRYEV